MINNLEAYKVFYYVAKCGSVTKAAGELSISQPAVSQAVKQLENTLDVSLFHRAAKGVRLTGERACALLMSGTSLPNTSVSGCTSKLITVGMAPISSARATVRRMSAA